MVSCLVVNDTLKVAMIRWHVANSLAEKPVDMTPEEAQRRLDDLADTNLERRGAGPFSPKASRSLFHHSGSDQARTRVRGSIVF
jgi:hypothetical protein